MRFFEDGPAIPDTLLVQSDAGNVVFFCGAGISRYPEGQGPRMPCFVELAECLVEYSKASPSSEIGRWLVERKRDKNHVSMDLDKIFNKLKDRDFLGKEDVNKEVARILNSEDVNKKELTRHKHISQISRDANGNPRVVTTNFDVLFERAVEDKDMKVHIPPINIDLSRIQLPPGVVYLHGRIPEETRHFCKDKSVSNNLILSTSDLGEAYLTKRWALTFISELFSKYVVVFIGYSASDVTVEYLLHGLNTSRGLDQQNLYVLDKRRSEDIDEKWKDMGIQTIPYADHDILWKTIEAWAERSKDPSEWKRRVLHMAQVDPRTLTRHERGQVFHVGRTIDGMQLFSELNPAADPRWVNVFDTSIRRGLPIHGGRPEELGCTPLSDYGLDDDPPYIEMRKLKEEASEKMQRIRRSMYGIDTNPHGDTQETKAELEEISQKCNEAWICGNLDSPVMAWWVARQPSVNLTILDSMRSMIENSENLSQKAKLMWEVIIEYYSRAFHIQYPDPWISFRFSIKNHVWISSTYEIFKLATTPHLRLVSKYDTSRFSAPDEDWRAVDLEAVAYFTVKFPARYDIDLEIDDGILSDVITILQDNLILASRMRSKIQDLYGGIVESPTCYRHRDVSGDSQCIEFSFEIEWFLNLYEQLIESNPASAKTFAEKWTFDDPYFFRKLKLFALNHNSLFDIDEVYFWIEDLSEEQFWCENSRRELLFLLKDRWNEFSEIQRQGIVEKILFPPYSIFESDADDAYEKAELCVAICGRWLDKNECRFPEKSLIRLDEIVNGLSIWSDDWSQYAVSTSYPVVEWVGVDEDPSMIENTPFHRVIEEVDMLTKHDRNVRGFRDRDPFSGLVDEKPIRTLMALIDAKRRGLYPTDHWGALVRKWSPDVPSALSEKFMGQLAGLPESVLCDIRYELGRYLRDRHHSMLSVSSKLAWRVFDKCITAWMQDCEAPTDMNEFGGISYVPNDHDSGRTYGYALRHPFGLATLFLMSVFGTGAAGIPDEVKSRLEDLLDSLSKGRHQCASILTWHIAWLYRADRDWTTKNVLSLLENGHDLEEASLSGLSSCQLPLDSSAFATIKHIVIGIYPRVYDFNWSDYDHGRCTHLIVEAGTIYRGQLTEDEELELTECFRNMRENDRAKSILYLKEIGNDTKDGWSKSVIPFLKSIWPKNLPFRNELITKSLVEVLSNSGDSFCDVFSAAKPFLASFEDDSSATPNFYRKGEGKDGIISKFPNEVLELFDIVISPEMTYPPLHLKEILSVISRAKKTLEGDKRYIRLLELARKAKSR